MIYKRGKHWHMDVVISGVRYREALDTTDKREAPGLMNKRIAEIQAGKAPRRQAGNFPGSLWRGCEGISGRAQSACPGPHSPVRSRTPEAVREVLWRSTSHPLQG